MPNMENIELDRQKRMAVAYLAKNEDERPGGLEKFFKKLNDYNGFLRDVMMATKEAESSLNELYARKEQIIGSITSVVDMVVDELPDEKCIEWASKYNEPIADPSMPGSTQMKKAEGIDMAGSTAKQGSPAEAQSTPEGAQTA